MASGGQRARLYRATDIHIWKGSEVLGTGAYGTVFKGYDKRTGTTVAVKALSESERHVSPMHVEQHEKEVGFLRSLRHPNIVGLIGVEDELDDAGRPTRGKVIVMEYCNQGSLHALIEEPENALGLQDSVLLHVLRDVVAGLRYLREHHKLAHRDFKPSNILKTVTPDGEVLYKLCDFGAAKVLDDSEAFKSIVGTEEYLHPDIYQRAFRKGEAKSTFDSSSDLWSIGVTLYQLATGQLPFQILGGARSNRRAMLEMTMKKPTGSIAGSEELNSAGKVEIQWSFALPDNVTASLGLRRELRGLLAALLELSVEARLSYDGFFQRAQDLLAKTPTHALCLATATKLVSYSNERRLWTLLSAGAEETFVPADYVAVHRGRVLDWEAEGRPHTTPDEPILLLPHQPQPIKADEPESIALPAPAEGGPETSQADFVWAKCVCGMGYMGRRRLHGLAQAVATTERAARDLHQANTAKVGELEARVEGWGVSWASVEREWREARPSSAIAQRKAQTADAISRNALDVEDSLVQAKALLLEADAAADPAAPALPVASGQELLGAALKEGRQKLDSFQRDQTLLRGRSVSKDEKNWHRLMKKNMELQMGRIAEALSGAPFKAYAAGLGAAVERLAERVRLAHRLAAVEKDLEDVAAMVRSQQDSIAKALSSSASAAALSQPSSAASPAQAGAQSLPNGASLGGGKRELAEKVRELSRLSTRIRQGLVDSERTANTVQQSLAQAQL